MKKGDDFSSPLSNTSLIQMTMRYCHDLTTMDEKRNAMALAMAVNS